MGMNVIIILYCCAVAEILLAAEGGESGIGTAEVVAIVIAVIGVASGIWSQVIQFKKDRQRIEGVNETAKNVKNDTTEMKPQINTIYNNVNILHDSYIRREYRIDEVLDGINELVKAKQLDEKIKEKISATVESPLYIENAVKLIYEKNALLESENVVIKSENNILQAENRSLKDKIRKLESINRDGRDGR